MKPRIGAALSALAFLALFGGLGGLGLWFTGGSVYDGLRARDWVKVKADITHVDTGTVTFAYVFQDRKYVSDRVGTFAPGGSTDLDDWEDRMDAMISTAVAEKRPVTAFVNPDRPAEAMLDREIRWKFVLVLMGISFAAAVGGLVAFFAIGRKALGGKSSGGSVPWLRPRAREAVTQWLVALVWNGVSLPIALVAIPDLWRSGDWFPIVLLLLFPAIGLLILWSALRSTAASFGEGIFNERSAA